MSQGLARVGVLSSPAVFSPVAFECSKGFKSCKNDSKLCVRSVFSFEKHWEFYY